MSPHPLPHRPLSRRAFAQLCAATAAGMLAPRGALAAKDFRLRYVLASAMYGTLPVAEILPEIARSGAVGLDLWPKKHGSQREEVTAMGVEKFGALLKETNVRVEAITRFDLGPFRLAEELEVARMLGAEVIVCGSSGPRGLKGEELKKAVREFAEKMKPHAALAEEKGVKIAIENHGNALIEEADSMRWLVESIASPNLGIALAPYHLPQDPVLLAQLIADLGPRLHLFYAWQHGKGATQKLPKEQELLQMPGRGELDFAPLLGALRKSGFAGLTEIFMHPTPRGIPILDTATEVTAEINRARRYLDERVAAL